MFQNASIVGPAEVELMPVGSIFCVNAEKFLKQYAPGFLIKIKRGEYYYQENGNRTFNNEKYTGVETYQEDGFEYYYTDIRNFNLKFKLFRLYGSALHISPRLRISIKDEAFK